MNRDTSKLLSTAEVGARLGERAGTVARWAKEEWIEARKVDGEWRIPASEVERIEGERYRQRKNGEKERSPKPKRPPPGPPVDPVKTAL